MYYGKTLTVPFEYFHHLRFSHFPRRKHGCVMALLIVKMVMMSVTARMCVK